MSCIGTGYHMKCRNCGKRIKGARYAFCKTCREMDAVLRCACGFVGEPDSREVRTIQECGSELYCPRCGKVSSRATA